MRCFLARFTFVVLASFAILAQVAQAGPIEAIKGKKYRLSKQHGPWMIMVASIAPVPEERRLEGISYTEAADALVYELRRKGIPAYTLSNREVLEQMKRQGRRDGLAGAMYGKQPDRISVIAGNYPSITDVTAQDTLKWVKKFRPRSWEGQEAIYKRKQRGPLEGAFLTINPLLSPQEVAEREYDPLLHTLNSGQSFSLLDSKGTYTLVVASFYGKALTTQATQNRLRSAFDRFKKEQGTLDLAAANANQLTKLLREGAVQGSKTIRNRRFEAYVFHDKFRSLVTVGSFQSPTDPKLKQFQQMFGAKSQPDAKGKILGEFLHVPNPRGLRFPPIHTFAFDPSPQVMRIPQVQQLRR